MKSARKENKFSNLIELFQNLTDEDNCQRAESSVNLIKKEAENETNESKRENSKDEEDKKDENDKE